MKISNLTEMDTPSSMPDNNTSAPKFGRSDEMLESGVGTTTSGGVATDAKPMGKMRTRGQGSMFKGISTSSKYANSRKAGISEDSVNEDELSEEQLKAKKRREENFKKAKDRELGNKPQSRDIMTKEAFNGEYDDEAGMFKNNLQTIQRVSTHLEKAIADNENLPEWCQEKIGVAKSMVVTVMDYMISQHENGERPTVGEAGPGIPFRGVGGAFNRGDDERHDLDTTKPSAPQVWGLKINGKVWTKVGKSVTFTSKEAALKSRDSILKTRPDLEIGLVTRGGTTGPQSKTDDNFQAYLAQRKAGQQGVAEGLIDDDTAKTAYMYGLRHGREGVGNNMDRAKAEWGDNFKYYNAGFLKGRNKKAQSLKAVGQGYGNKEQGVAEEWSQKYKSSINCSHPKGFSQKAHCAGKKKQNESIETEMTCPDCGMCETHGDNENLDEACWKGYHKEGNKKMFGKTYPNCVKNTNEEQEQLDEKCWDTHKQVGMKSKGGKQVPNCVPKESVEEQHNHSENCPHCGGEMVSEELMNEKKDACYYKVKSRYKVWPSAYASGALVKCRNKGASNWGNGGQKSESMTEEELEESLHDWFNKEKWVRMDTKGKIKGPCAREPGEGKPKCLPQSKAHSLGKKGRASAAARKRREDPNPERSGKAINVNTKKKS